MKWRMKRGGFFSMLIPSRGFRNKNDRKSLLLSKQHKGAESPEEKIRDLTLTNASNIGTALMVTNSYRVLAILWAITGLFPIFVSLSSTSINALAKEMTEQLQEINLVANDTSNETCVFLHTSVSAWTKGVTSPKYMYQTNHRPHYEKRDFDEPFLLTLDLQPYRCNFEPKTFANMYNCTDTVDPELRDACETWDSLRLENSTEGVADAQGVREGSVLEFTRVNLANLTNVTSAEMTDKVEFSVQARFDHSYLVATA
jgi:hypothetical protein